MHTAPTPTGFAEIVRNDFAEIFENGAKQLSRAETAKGVVEELGVRVRSRSLSDYLATSC
jgi:hypothetical protein